jgi:hypothetical protein
MRVGVDDLISLISLLIAHRLAFLFTLAISLCRRKVLKVQSFIQTGAAFCPGA